MSIKRILVPLPASTDHAAEIDMALAVATTFDACVEALYIDQPISPASIRSGVPYQYALAEGGTPRGAPVGELVARQHEERERGALSAKERFASACAARAIAYSEAKDQMRAPPSATWRRAEGAYDTTAAERAVAFDLVVATSAAIADTLKDIAETSLLRTRRPVLLAPERHDGGLADTVMIAWDASPECWHAVSAALPFLKHAQSVQIVSVDRDEASRRDSQHEVLRYLSCHRIDAAPRVVAPQSRSIGATLLNVAAEERAGLLVMGAYSHSRWREMLLGGATRHVLMNAAATPVLMVH